VSYGDCKGCREPLVNGEGLCEECAGDVGRLKRALGEIAELGDRCEECDPPNTMATHVTWHPETGLPVFLCDACAEERRSAGRSRPEIEPHEQDLAVLIALRALGLAPLAGEGEGGPRT
jgi:hypothetical protein